MPASPLTDKAVAVFAFAAYRQLSSGETLVDIVLRDGAGHSADPRAIAELEGRSLVSDDAERATVTGLTAP